MTKKDFVSYSAHDFLDDADFIRYIKYNKKEDIAFWKDWELGLPINLKEFRYARTQLRVALSVKPILISDHFKTTLLQDINLSIEAQQVAKRKKFIRLAWSSGLAASLLIGVCILWFAKSEITVYSGFAQNRVVTLPDGSVVRLNANSTLSYRRAFNWLRKRTVKIQGEAYFDVRHINQNPEKINDGELFVAITDNIQIQVLGTEFNLKDRHHQTNVALIKGKIKVTSTKTGASYLLIPGQSIHFDNGNYVHENHQFSNQTAWLSGKIVVNQTTIFDIIREFEDLYGYKIMLDDPALGRKKIDGTISIQSEDNLLFTLKNILNVDIEKEGKIIYLKSRK